MSAPPHHSHSGSLPTMPCACARRAGNEKRAVRTHSGTSLFHHQLSPFSSTHSSSPPLSPSTLALPTRLLLLFLSIALLLLSPWVPATCERVDWDAAALGGKKKRGEKRSAAISTGRPSPFASLCQKREGFFTTPSPRILTLCLLLHFSARSAPQYHATSGFALLLLRHAAPFEQAFFFKVGT